MRHINQLRYCLMAAIPLVALAACSSDSGAASVRAAPSVVIVIDAVPTADAAGLHRPTTTASRSAGLSPINPINGGEYGMGALQANTAQLIEETTFQFILARSRASSRTQPNNSAQVEASKPIDMRLIADASQMQPGNQALYVLPSSPLQDGAALVQHKIKVGVNSLNNIGSVLLGSLLAANGTQWTGSRRCRRSSRDARATQRAQDSRRVASRAVRHGGQQDYGAVQVADFDQGSRRTSRSAPSRATPLGASHPNTVAAFLRAYNEGSRSRHQPGRGGEVARRRRAEADQGDRRDHALDTYPLVMDVPVMQRWRTRCTSSASSATGSASRA